MEDEAAVSRLYHVGFDEIRQRDLRRERKNADFGQGFYLSDNEDFSRRWARERKGLATRLRFVSSAVLNSEEIARWRETVVEEERAFQELFARTLERILTDGSSDTEA